MEQDFRFNQVKGWTDKLGAEHIPAQFVQELETFIAKGEKPLVRLRDEIVAEYATKEDGTTLYALTLPDTLRVRSAVLEVQFIKGTRRLPEAKLLASITSPAVGFIGIPLIDLRHLTPAERDEIEAQKREAERQLNLCKQFNDTLSSAEDLQDRAGKQVGQFFENINELALLYAKHNSYAREARPPVTPEQLIEIEKMCKVEKVFSVGQTDIEQPFLTVLFPNVEIVFQPDREPSKMHKDLFGARYTIGDIRCYLRIVPKKLTVPGLFEYTVQARFGAASMRNGLLHPHIQRSGEQFDGMYLGKPCWGSYDTPFKEAAHRLDVMGMLRLIKDFLTSCSESGWYGSVNYWADAERLKKFCSCGRTKIARGVDHCETCQWRRSEPNSTITVEEAARVTDTPEAPRG